MNRTVFATYDRYYYLSNFLWGFEEFQLVKKEGA